MLLDADRDADRDVGVLLDADRDVGVLLDAAVSLHSRAEVRHVNIKMSCIRNMSTGPTWLWCLSHAKTWLRDRAGNALADRLAPPPPFTIARVRPCNLCWSM